MNQILPEILVISLASRHEKRYQNLMASLWNISRVVQISALSDAVHYLVLNDPRAVIFTDEGITDPSKWTAVARYFQTYLQNGGIVIFGVYFANFCDAHFTEQMFRHMLCLPWSFSGVAQLCVEINDECIWPNEVLLNKFEFPEWWMAHFRYLTNVQPHERILESPLGCRGDEGEYISGECIAPVVGARIGDGYVAYFGGLGYNECCDRVLARLCSLEDRTRSEWSLYPY
ncbi:uncharacterized protein LDX57_009146 [Aspergillus melleus]|uniref:uncharacterized protein n=1 Tax=Aspergillus melleus TaxID=138277 RepID=UPI001E8EBCCA|nr:uncharacterized protein LDX57_009146 [Aspergillus melleus]KAH8431483.1 hypothetical protein LDX57_009146 [Aspergillus melleus]